MKKLILIGLASLFMVCSPKRESAMSLLAYIVMTSPTETGEKSIVIIENSSPFIYTGTCYDAFYGITASNYYNIFYKNVVKSEYTKIALSSSSCSSLSFSGGYENWTEDGFKMDMYKCGAVPKSCSSSAKKAAGF